LQNYNKIHYTKQLWLKNFLNKQKIAKASIYDDARYLGMWNGYEVYEPIFNDDEVHYTGFSQFILAKNNALRWTKDHTESIAIMNKSYADE
jgi:hypothetical protein